MLSDELLVSTAAFLGVRDLGRLSRVSTRFVRKCILSQAGARGRLTVVDTVAKLAVLRATHLTHSDRGTRLLVPQPGETWLHVLAALPDNVCWLRCAESHYTVSEAGARLTAKGAPQFRVALGGAPMVAGGAGVNYVEVEIGDPDSPRHQPTVVVGVGSSGLDTLFGVASVAFWGVYSMSGCLYHASAFEAWEGMQPFRQGDTLGLLLDCADRRLILYKNGVRLGVAVSGLAGELCWAAAIFEDGGSVHITGKSPPLGWRNSD